MTFADCRVASDWLARALLRLTWMILRQQMSYSLSTGVCYSGRAAITTQTEPNACITMHKLLFPRSMTKLKRCKTTSHNMAAILQVTLWSIDNWQNKVSGDQYLVTILHAKLTADQVLVFRSHHRFKPKSRAPPLGLVKSNKLSWKRFLLTDSFSHKTNL